MHIYYTRLSYLIPKQAILHQLNLGEEPTSPTTNTSCPHIWAWLSISSGPYSYEGFQLLGF